MESTKCCTANCCWTVLKRLIATTGGSDSFVNWRLEERSGVGCAIEVVNVPCEEF